MEHYEPLAERDYTPPAEHASEPHVKHASEPHVKPAAESSFEPASEPHVERASEPHVQPTSELLIELATEPQVKSASEPHVELAVESSLASEPQTKPTAESSLEFVSELPVKPSSNLPVEHTSLPVEPGLESPPDSTYFRPRESYNAWKTWKESGGLDSFAAQYNVRADDLVACKGIPYDIYMAYYEATMRIPGLREEIEQAKVAWSKGCPSIEFGLQILMDHGEFGGNNTEKDQDVSVSARL
ncbi:hypothetical protein BDV95DRAFT_618804 [Massariosphaeria phaeospora]|uniref:Uncharacterized protein n=1 Tax=Massariosphaeria phaeospora TaxID=100035 RepID=A0A7C8MNQ9_9PLEO|nr:hypothetical protein BDV95DRAFT_618804 [Massariosphaeria phaeospora]